MQKLIKNEQRVYIKSRVALEQAPIAIYNDLVKIHGNNAYKYNTVLTWAKRFKDGQSSTEDDPRSGRPITATRGFDVELVADVVEEDPFLSIRDIEELTSLSYGTIQRILHDHLELRKVSSRWVPHLLTPENKAHRLGFAQAMLAKLKSGQWRFDQILTGDESWFYHRKIKKRSECRAWKKPGEDPETIVKRDRFEPKSMVSIFFRTTGLVHIYAVDKKDTLDSRRYIHNCLEPAFDEVKRQRPSSGLRGILLLHDNARPHVSKMTRSFIEEQGVTEIDHPPYSPDLAPCDYWLFDYIKQHLEDVTSSETLVTAITAIMKKIDKKEYFKTFQKYVERLEYCILVEGDYFEHLLK